MNALLSIKPKYVDRIISGEKKYEFRKIIFQKQKNIEKVYIYSSSPIKKIVGYFTLGKVIKEAPLQIWETCSQKAGISLEEFEHYFQKRDYGFALEIKQFHLFRTPINPYEVIDSFTPPQNFRYLLDDID